MNNYLRTLKNYTKFSGRATKSEFWIFIVVNLLIFITLALLEQFLFPSTNRSEFNLNPLTYIQLGFMLFFAIPTVSVSFRRMHDIDKSGLWNLLFFIPLLGGIALIFFFIQDSDPEPNQYGPYSKEQPLQAQTI